MNCIDFKTGNFLSFEDNDYSTINKSVWFEKKRVPFI